MAATTSSPSKGERTRRQFCSAYPLPPEGDVVSCLLRWRQRPRWQPLWGPRPAGRAAPVTTIDKDCYGQLQEAPPSNIALMTMVLLLDAPFACCIAVQQYNSQLMVSNALWFSIHVASLCRQFARPSISTAVSSPVRVYVRPSVRTCMIRPSSVRQFVRPTVLLSVRPSVRSYVRLDIGLSPVRSSIDIVRPSFCPAVHPNFRQSVRSCVCSSTIRSSYIPSIIPSVRSSVDPSFHSFIYPHSFHLQQ